MHWYQGRAEFELRAGGDATFIYEAGEEGGKPEVTSGKILELDPPRVLAFDETASWVRSTPIELQDAYHEKSRRTTMAL
ncbi:MAG: hypothetical protein ACREX8_18210 [Gammaproteobacteria bacterium]